MQEFRDMDTGTEAKTIGEHCLMVRFPLLEQPALLYSPEIPTQWCHFPLWTQSHHINRQLRQSITDIATGPSDEGNLSIEVPFPQ